METGVKYLLVQGKAIVDIADSPSALLYSAVDDKLGFKVIIGCINEFNQAEIVGIIANIGELKDSPSWRICSAVDGNTVIKARKSPIGLVRDRLGMMFRYGYFYDLCRLPVQVTISPEMR
jgi:hypothetical protein